MNINICYYRSKYLVCRSVLLLSLLFAPIGVACAQDAAPAVPNHPASDAFALLSALEAEGTDKATPSKVDADKATISAILKRYGYADPTAAQNNPFLNMVPGLSKEAALGDVGILTQVHGGFTVDSVNAAPAVLPNFGLDPGTLAGILADALQGTLDEAAIDELSEILTRYPALQVMFPKAWSDLNDSGFKQSTNLPSKLTTLKADFHDDTRQILDHVNPALAYLDIKNDRHAQYYVFEVIVTAANDALKKQPVVAIVEDMEKSGAAYEAQTSDPTLNPPTDATNIADVHKTRAVEACDLPIKLAAFFAHMLLADDNSNVVSIDDLKKYEKVSAAFYYPTLIGLAVADDANYQLLPAIQAEAQDCGLKLDLAGDVDSAAQYLTATETLVAQLATALPELAGKNEQDISAGVNGLIAALAAYPPIRNDAAITQDLTTLGNAVTLITGSVVPLYEDVKDKDYADALTELTKAAKALAPSAAALEAEASAAKNKSIRLTASTAAPTTAPDTFVEGALSFLSQYGPEVGDLINAKSQADLEKLGSADLLALSDTSRKQVALDTFSIDVPVGIQIARKTLSGGVGGTTAKQSSTAIFGVAQIGPEYSTSRLNFGGDGFGVSSVSAFVPIIDLGALVSSDITKGSNTATDSSWSNVWAPGFYVVIGLKFPKTTPVLDSLLRRMAIEIGTQYGPRLEKVSTTSGNTIDKAAWRAPSFQLTFDLLDFPIGGGTSKISSP
jgi:hypothetical protein